MNRFRLFCVGLKDWFGIVVVMFVDYWGSDLMWVCLRFVKTGFVCLFEACETGFVCVDEHWLFVFFVIVLWCFCRFCCEIGSWELRILWVYASVNFVFSCVFSGCAPPPGCGLRVVFIELGAKFCGLERNGWQARWGWLWQPVFLWTFQDKFLIFMDIKINNDKRK